MKRNSIYGWLRLLVLITLLIVFAAGNLLARAVPMSAVSPPTRGPAQAEPSITYDQQANTIIVKGPGSVVDLTDIQNTLKNDAWLERTGPAEWLLKVNLRIFEGVRLELHGEATGGDVDWLKLRSEPSGYVSIESSNGQISIKNTRITSWDTRTRDFDKAFLDNSGRAFISAKNRRANFTDNRMDVINSEIAYLGFFEETAYGISWKVISVPGTEDTGILGRGLTGTITGSKFHHNYFGVYVWGVGDMQVRDNEFSDNYRYGFDAHTFTQRTIVEDNVSHDNGQHGIIFADRSTENIVRRNTVTNNKGHGVMLHELSDNNIIENNTVIGNDDGVPLFESSNNTVRNNVLRNNTTGVRVYGRASESRNNLFENNEISRSRSHGVFMYDAAVANTFRNNQIFSNSNAGVYLKSVFDNIFTGNTVRNNEFGVQLDSAEPGDLSRGNEIRDNSIEGNRRFGILSYAPLETNLLQNSQFSGNRLGDISYFGQGPASGGGQGFIASARPFFFAAIVFAAVVTALFAYWRSRTRSSS